MIIRNLRKQLEKYQATLAKRLDKVSRKEGRRPLVANIRRQVGGNKRRSLLYALAGQQLKEVTEALERLDEGVYGHCVVCGEPLDENRLQAMPTATHCWNCQQEMQSKNLHQPMTEKG